MDFPAEIALDARFYPSLDEDENEDTTSPCCGRIFSPETHVHPSSKDLISIPASTRPGIFHHEPLTRDLVLYT